MTQIIHEIAGKKYVLIEVPIISGQRGKNIWLGAFPFNSYGEKAAGEKYEAYLKKNNIEHRYAEKKKYKKHKTK